MKVGVHVPTIHADLVRRGLEPQLLHVNPATPLPETMQEAPIIELTELYLDERPFYEHAGPKDYLGAYGEVMTPGLQNKQATIRLGNPTLEIVDKVLAPMLLERVEHLPESCVLWRRPTGVDAQTSILL